MFLSGLVLGLFLGFVFTMVYLAGWVSRCTANIYDRAQAEHYEFKRRFIESLK